MISNFLTFDNLVAKISECRKRMTIVRHEIHLHEESGQAAEHQKRELFNLSNQLNLLQSELLNFQRNKRVRIF